MRLFKKHHHLNLKRIGKKISNGVHTVAKKINQTSNAIENGLGKAENVSKKVGNILEKATPGIEAGLAAVTLAQPELAPLTGGAIAGLEAGKRFNSNIGQGVSHARDINTKLSSSANFKFN